MKSRTFVTGWSSGIARKAITTLCVGGGTFLISQAFNQNISESLLLSVFVGGVTFVVQLLVDFDKRLEALEAGQSRHLATVEALIETMFARISEATELFGRVESSPIRIELVKQLVHHAANLDPSADQLLHLFAHSELTRATDFMKALSQRGEITYDGEDRDWLLALTRNAQATIDATSFMAVDASGQSFNDGGLWASDLGQRYLDEQQKALDRRVTIRRIFILDDPGQARDPKLLQTCEAQQKLGILVRILDPLTIPDLNRNWMFDFILFDSTISYESTPAAWTEKETKPAIVSTRLVINPHRVDQLVGRYEGLWAAARELDSIGEQLSPGGSATD